MPYSKGIHAHPTKKLGLQPPVDKPALLAGTYLTTQVPAHPPALDRLKKSGLTFGLYKNDTYGDCGPTGVANIIRGISLWLTGEMVEPSLEDVLAFYKVLNPDFDPDHPNADGTYPGDNGVVLQDMLSALVTHGIGDGKGGTIKALGFAKADPSNDAEMDALLALCGFGLQGVNLEVSQQGQSDQQVIVWDYAAPHSEWGGHCVAEGAYDESTARTKQISWQEEVDETEDFRRRQLDEFWIVIFQWHLDHPDFLAGVDLQALAADYKQLTGRDFPAVVPTPSPTPTPAPTPPEPSSGCLQVGPFSRGTLRRLGRLAEAKGYGDDETGVEAFLTHVIKFGGRLP
jgi:hypothetical protein